METTILVIHVLSAISLVAIILVQRSEGGALSGLGGGGNPASGLMSARGTASALTRTTAILAIIFMTSGLLLASVTSQASEANAVIEKIAEPTADEVPLAE